MKDSFAGIIPNTVNGRFKRLIWFAHVDIATQATRSSAFTVQTFMGRWGIPNEYLPIRLLVDIRLHHRTQGPLDGILFTIRAVCSHVIYALVISS